MNDFTIRADQSVRSVGHRVPCANLGRRPQQRVERPERRQLGVALLQRGYEDFGRNVPDQRILRKGASTEAADGGIEATAACVISGKNFRICLLGAAVQMHSNF